MSVSYCNNRRRVALTIAAGIAAFAVSVPVPAAERAGGPAVSVHIGHGKHYRRVALNWETSPWWTHRFDNGTRVELSGEFGVARWRADSGRTPDSAWQVSAIPLFRWWASEHYFVEGGIGPTLFSTTRFAGKRIGSAYQFGDHIGAGVALSASHRVSVRYSHFSNAGIRRPNPGLDIFQVTYSLTF